METCVLLDLLWMSESGPAYSKTWVVSLAFIGFSESSIVVFRC
jgi:hypothetical protein